MGRPLCGRLPGDSLGGRGRPPLWTGSKGISLGGGPLCGVGVIPARGGTGQKGTAPTDIWGEGRPGNGSVGKDSHPVFYISIELAWDRGVSLINVCKSTPQFFFLWMGVRVAPRAGLTVFPAQPHASCSPLLSRHLMNFALLSHPPSSPSTIHGCCPPYLSLACG